MIIFLKSSPVFRVSLGLNAPKLKFVEAIAKVMRRKNTIDFKGSNNIVQLRTDIMYCELEIHP